MPKLTLSHFETAVLFALFTSVVMGIVSKQTDKERIRYGFRCFAWFMVALFAIAWAMRHPAVISVILPGQPDGLIYVITARE